MNTSRGGIINSILGLFIPVPVIDSNGALSWGCTLSIHKIPIGLIIILISIIVNIIL